MILGGGSPVEQAGVDQKNLNSFADPGRVILGGGSPVEQAGVDQKNLNSFTNPGGKTPYSPLLWKTFDTHWPVMDAGRGQRQLVPNSFAETSYPEPSVVPVAGVYVWPVHSGVAGRHSTFLGQFGV